MSLALFGNGNRSQIPIFDNILELLESDPIFLQKHTNVFDFRQ